MSIAVEPYSRPLCAVPAGERARCVGGPLCGESRVVPSSWRYEVHVRDRVHSYEPRYRRGVDGNVLVLLHVGIR